MTSTRIERYWQYLRYLTLLAAAEEWAPVSEVEADVAAIDASAVEDVTRDAARKLILELVREGLLTLGVAPGPLQEADSLPPGVSPEDVLLRPSTWSTPTVSAPIVVVELTTRGSTEFHDPARWAGMVKPEQL